MIDTQNEVELFRKIILKPDVLTIKQAAEMLGMTATGLSKWMNNKLYTPHDFWNTVKRVFGYDIKTGEFSEKKESSIINIWHEATTNPKEYYMNDIVDSVRYFISYFVMEKQFGMMKAANIVLDHDGKIEDDNDIRNIEEFIANDKGINTDAHQIIIMNFKKLEDE